MKRHILTAVLISGLVCSSLASCTLETYESTTPRSANWSVSTPANTPENNVQTPAPQQADNNSQQTQEQQSAAPAQQAQQTEQAPAQTQAAAPVQQQAPAVQPPKADPPEVTASPAQKQAAVNDYSEYIPIAKNIMNSLDTLDSIAGGSNVSIDSSDTVQDNGCTYSKVLDYRFSSLNDVTNFVNTMICGDLIYRYSGLYSGEAPTFKEFNGSLYYLSETRGCGFGYQGDPTITSASGGSFTFNVQIASGGGVKTFTVNAVNDGGTWKACSFNYT